MVELMAITHVAARSISMLPAWTRVFCDFLCAWLAGGDVKARHRVGGPCVARTVFQRLYKSLGDRGGRRCTQRSHAAPHQRGMTNDRQAWLRRLANGDHWGRNLRVVRPR